MSWNLELPPLEILALVNQRPAGRSLDLGCGFGRACIYLAKHGWQCDGVDFVEQTVVTARQRAAAASVADHNKQGAGQAELPGNLIRHGRQHETMHCRLTAPTK